MAKNRKRQTSDPINAAPLTQEQINTKYADRKRVGKTARDKARSKA